jgi:hypothetical protein
VRFVKAEFLSEPTVVASVDALATEREDWYFKRSKVERGRDAGEVG